MIVTKRIEFEQAAETDKATSMLYDMYHYTLLDQEFPRIVKLEHSKLEYELKVS